MGKPTSTDWRRLAGYVARRRTALGLTQEEVSGRGGPSTATMRLIEGALQDSYRPVILARLETALQWAPGSVEAILGGGEPSPMGPPPTADSALRRAELAIRRIEDVLDFPGLDKSMRLDTIRGIIFNYRAKAPRPGGVDVAQPDDDDQRPLAAG